MPSNDNTKQSGISNQAWKSFCGDEFLMLTSDSTSIQ